MTALHAPPKFEALLTEVVTLGGRGTAPAAMYAFITAELGDSPLSVNQVLEMTWQRSQADLSAAWKGAMLRPEVREQGKATPVPANASINPEGILDLIAEGFRVPVVCAYIVSKLGDIPPADLDNVMNKALSATLQAMDARWAHRYPRTPANAAPSRRPAAPESAAPTFHVAMPPVPAAQVVFAHPSRAVQRVERDPQSLEIMRTVTTYDPPDASSRAVATARQPTR